MYSATHSGYVVIIHWCRRSLPVFIDAHVSIWAIKLGDIEEEICPISVVNIESHRAYNCNVGGFVCK